jgi:hypothetical protein
MCQVEALPKQPIGHGKHLGELGWHSHLQA